MVSLHLITLKEKHFHFNKWLQRNHGKRKPVLVVQAACYKKMKSITQIKENLSRQKIKLVKIEMLILKGVPLKSISFSLHRNVLNEKNWIERWKVIFFSSSRLGESSSWFLDVKPIRAMVIHMAKTSFLDIIRCFI